MGYEVIERTIDKKGQILLVPDIEVNIFKNSLLRDCLLCAFSAINASHPYRFVVGIDCGMIFDE